MQFRNAGLLGLVEIETAVEQAVQTAFANANQRHNERQSPGNQGSWKTNGQRRICKTHQVAPEDHRVADRCVWRGFPVMEWVEDQDNVIANDALEPQPFWLKDVLYGHFSLVGRLQKASNRPLRGHRQSR